MSANNPQIDGQLDKLSELLCMQLESETDGRTIEDPVIDQLLKSLLMSGYARKEGANLQVDIENRVKAQCREPAMHRGGALSSITGQLQKKFEDLKRWESQQPKDKTDAKAANISSATDA